MNWIIISKEQAEARGLESITDSNNPYVLGKDDWMIRKVLSDLDRDKIECAVVRSRISQEKAEIWRRM